MDGNEEINQMIEMVVAANENRASAYRLLAMLYYRELTEDQITALSRAHLDAEGTGDALMDEGYGLIARDLRHHDSGTRQRLACDYAHTFLAAGTYDERMATPFESVFTSKEGLLMQDARDDVCKMYYAEHIAPRDDENVPEDHISFEFEFLAHLAERVDDALRSSDIAEAQRLNDVSSVFLSSHILNWVDDLCDVIDSVARTRFYRGLSCLTRGYTRADAGTLADMSALLLEIGSDAVNGSADVAVPFAGTSVVAASTMADRSDCGAYMGCEV